jgi:hypothetical protein
MRNKVIYEWCIEHYTDDEYQDIVDNHFSDSLTFKEIEFEANDGEKTRLVLVRNEGNDDNGLEDRHWAYVEDGKLPQFFSDAMGEFIAYEVPKRFHKELANYLKLQTA